MFRPWRSQRCMIATSVVWQLTTRRQRVDRKKMSPSGSQIGSMSSYGPSVNGRRFEPSGWTVYR